MEEQQHLQKKLPYNLGRKKVAKKVDYERAVRPEIADKLYDRILFLMIVRKRYLDPTLSAKKLAKELNINSPYLSAVINFRFRMNFYGLLNQYRIKDACHLLRDKRYKDKTVEEIGKMVGYTTRPGFYTAFYREMGMPPKKYRLEQAEK